MKRKISMLVLLAMLATMAVSCAGDGTGDDTTDSASESTTTEAVVDESIRLDLDPSLNYNGAKINVLSYEGYFEGDDEENASALNRAKYLQTLRTSERLGVEFSLVQADPFPQVSALVTQSINTQTDDYQIVQGAASTVVDLINQGYFLPIQDLTHVNTDKVWWNVEYSKSVSINENNPYVLFGDINYNDIERTTAMLFNKDLLLERRGMTDEELYDIVLDGEWTIDKFVELADGFHTDDGDGETSNDIKDIHGVTIWGNREYEYMIYSAGITITSRDDDGYPVLPESPTERMIDLVDKLLPLIKSQDTFYTDGTSFVPNAYVDEKFAGGTALFMPTRLFAAGFPSVQEMDDEYGIIPMPKYDETIDGYYCTSGNNVLWTMVPTLVQNVDMVSAVLESLAYEGYVETTPTYYEENLKLKYTRGDDIDKESQMIDLVRYGARIDFLYMNRLGGIGNVFAEGYVAGENNIVSAYASKYTMAQKTLENIINDLED